MNFESINIYKKGFSNDTLHVWSCKLTLNGLGEVEMKNFNISKEVTTMLKRELEMQIMARLGRDFREVFNEEKAVHSNGYQAQEVLPVPEESIPSVADMLGSQSVSSDMS